MQKHFPAVRPQAARTGSRPGGSSPVDEQVGDVVAAEVAAGERLVVLPQPLPDLGDRGAGEKQRTVAERLLAARGAVVFTIPSAVFNRPVRCHCGPPGRDHRRAHNSHVRAALRLQGFLDDQPSRTS